MLRIYPVELAAELKTGSRVPTTHRPTQLNSTQQSVVFIFLPNPSAVVVSWLRSQYTHRRRRRQRDANDIGGVYLALVLLDSY